MVRNEEFSKIGQRNKEKQQKGNLLQQDYKTGSQHRHGVLK